MNDDDFEDGDQDAAAAIRASLLRSKKLIREELAPAAARVNAKLEQLARETAAEHGVPVGTGGDA